MPENKTTLKEEIRKIFKYLRDTGEFPYDAPKVVFRKGDAQNSQVDAQNINLPTAHYDPNNDTIVILIYDGRFLRDFCISFLHELSHVKQNRENRLGNIQTDNVTEDGDLEKLEREAYEQSGIWFRKYKDSQKKPYFFKDPIKPYGIEIHDHLYRLVGEIQLNPERTAEIEGRENRGKFTVGDITYEYRIYSIQNPYNDGKNFYNVYFHPEGKVKSEPIGNTTKENYIIILNTMYKIITDFVNKFQPDYIGISSFDNNDSKNYHAVYNNLAQHNFLPGYRRRNANMPFETENGKGRFIVLQKRTQPPTPKQDTQDTLSEYMRNIANIILEADKQYTIYVDLDDTLIDFDGGFKKLTGKSYSTYKNEYGKIEAWNKIEEIGEKFWENLEWKKDSHILWEYLKKYNPIILTISPDESFIKEGKRKWVDKNISPSQKIIFAQVNGKGQYADENSILIDNKTNNIYNWIDNNGIGIHFTNVDDALNKIKQLGL